MVTNVRVLAARLIQGHYKTCKDFKAKKAQKPEMLQSRSCMFGIDNVVEVSRMGGTLSTKWGPMERPHEVCENLARHSQDHVQAYSRIHEPELDDIRGNSYGVKAE